MQTVRTISIIGYLPHHVDEPSTLHDIREGKVVILIVALVNKKKDGVSGDTHTVSSLLPYCVERSAPCP